MEFFNIILEVIQKEIERFNLDESVYIGRVSKFLSIQTENYDEPYNRCAYMYRYATCSISFMKKCISQFLLEYPKARDLLASWRSHSDLGLCSLSCGPGLDYLSFSLALSEWGETPDMFNTVKIITRNAAWRSTVDFLSESLAKAQLSSLVPDNLYYQNVEVTEGDIKKGFIVKMLDVFLSSKVVLMYKVLNFSKPLSEDEEAYIVSNLNALVSSLRPETTIFFIDTRTGVSLMQKAMSESIGEYLLLPSRVPYGKPLSFPEVYKQAMGEIPVARARGTFFVWQKASSHLFPELHILPEYIEPVAINEEDSNEIASNAKFPVIDFFGSSPSKTSNHFDDAESPKNSVSLASSIPGHMSTDMSPDVCEADNTKIDLFATQEDSPHRNLQTSELSASACSSQSDIPDSLLAELLNSSPQKTSTSTESESFDFQESISKISKKDSSITGPKDTDVIHGKTQSSTNLSRDCMNFAPLNVPPWDPGYVDSQKRIFESPASKNSEKLEKIRNLEELNNTTDPQFNLETKPIQTDLIFPKNNSPYSIKSLTDRINKLVLSFEKELAHESKPCGNHEMHFNRYHDCSLCASLSDDCNNQAKSLNSVDRENHSEFYNVSISDSDKRTNRDKFMKSTSSGAECSKSCSSNKHCLHHVHCCHSQRIPQCCCPSEPSFVNSPINVTVPSFVIPLRNISTDILSQILADVGTKINKL